MRRCTLPVMVGHLARESGKKVWIDRPTKKSKNGEEVRYYATKHGVDINEEAVTGYGLLDGAGDVLERLGVNRRLTAREMKLVLSTMIYMARRWRGDRERLRERIKELEGKGR